MAPLHKRRQLRVSERVLDVTCRSVAESPLHIDACQDLVKIVCQTNNGKEVMSKRLNKRQQREAEELAELNAQHEQVQQAADGSGEEDGAEDEGAEDEGQSITNPFNAASIALHI